MGTEPRLCLPPQPLRNSRGIRLPPGTCDSHFHVFSARAPLVSPRSYTPRMVGLEGWLELAESFGVARGVLVQPSVCGTDNSVLLSALLGHADRLRGVVVLAADTPATELQRLHGLGVRGLRINLRNKGGVGFDALAALAPQMRDLGWHVQFQTGPETMAEAADLARAHGLTGVIDHLGFMALNAPGPALGDLRRALDGGALVKMSAPYRLPDYADHAGYLRVVGSLAGSHPHSLLWGSDWPHTELFDRAPFEDDLAELTLAALPTTARQAVFVDNPARLYWAE